MRRAAETGARCAVPLPWLLIALAVLVVAAAAGSALASRRGGGIDAEVRRIAEELRCPVCRGQSVAESNSREAARMRDEVRAMLQAGKSRREVLDWYVARYGVWILNRPPLHGPYLLIWLAPAAALGGAGALLLRHLRQPREPSVAAGAAMRPPSQAGAPEGDEPGEGDLRRRLRDYL